MSLALTFLESGVVLVVVILAAWLIFFVGLTQSSDPETRFKSRGRS